MEYGREYSRWHAGRYLFPVDEVIRHFRLLLLLVMVLLLAWLTPGVNADGDGSLGRHAQVLSGCKTRQTLQPTYYGPRQLGQLSCRASGTVHFRQNSRSLLLTHTAQILDVGCGTGIWALDVAR